jgi:hypothetical protein
MARATRRSKSQAETLDIFTASVVMNRDAPFTYEVVLNVNGRPLQELLRGVDEPEAWVGPPYEVIKAPSRHLLGGENQWGTGGTAPYPEHKVAVLGCSCGQPECGALFMKITVMADLVTWTEPECFNRPEADTAVFPAFAFSSVDYLATVGGIHEPAQVRDGARHHRAHARHEPYAQEA